MWKVAAEDDATVEASTTAKNTGYALISPDASSATENAGTG